MGGIIEKKKSREKSLKNQHILKTIRYSQSGEHTGIKLYNANGVGFDSQSVQALHQWRSKIKKKNIWKISEGINGGITEKISEFLEKSLEESLQNKQSYILWGVPVHNVRWVSS